MIWQTIFEYIVAYIFIQNQTTPKEYKIKEIYTDTFEFI